MCANTGADLHLVEPLGFTLDAKSCRRAGLDYHDLANVAKHENLEDCLSALGKPRLFAVTKFATQRYDSPRFAAGDAFLFGAETTGLPAAIHDDLADSQKIGLPMSGGNRSLNLSNAVSIIIYEAWRQCSFQGMASPAQGKGVS
ncbi:MAG: tRNA (cytidine(34)-2'-O)-methyltransferase [Pseudomonadota bacterium]|nr:tRNA (cytidine(34)-2'-O)-methyltransferase [Pseudomonadota bacterium]